MYNSKGPTGKSNYKNAKVSKGYAKPQTYSKPKPPTKKSK